MVSFINGIRGPRNEEQQHDILRNLTAICEHIEVGHSGLYAIYPNSNVQIGVNAQEMMHKRPARGDRPSAHLYHC